MTSGEDNKEENTLENSSVEQSSNQKTPPSTASVEPELDDFGLPKRPVRATRPTELDDSDDDHETFHDAEASTDKEGASEGDAKETPCELQQTAEQKAEKHPELVDKSNKQSSPDDAPSKSDRGLSNPGMKENEKDPVIGEVPSLEAKAADKIPPLDTALKPDTKQDEQTNDSATSPTASRISGTVIPKRNQRSSPATASEWSHQRQIATANKSDEEEEEEEWQPMPAIDEFDIFDDNGRLVAKGHRETEDDANPYAGIGGAGKGYTRVQLDEDAQSATSLDEDTNYLFRNGQKMEDMENKDDQDDEQRDALSQLQATKDLLTEGQRIAYVGVVRLTIHKMFSALGDLEKTKGVRKELMRSLENMDMWGQKMMVRLYAHMDINQAEQIMIEQLAEHGVQPSDLVSPLMLNAKVRNPLADEAATETSKPDVSRNRDSTTSVHSSKVDDVPLKEVKESEEVPEVHGPEDMPHTKEIELDLRWTVLCDLFLVLISDGQYDARSRRLLERVGSTMEISWTQICRFEKRVIDALEMQEEEAKENWNESEHMEKRRKRALKKKYMVMGLATVGGGLVIGLSAGLLAPFIGAGLAAGFTTIGVTGTAGFLGGVGGAALITSAATAAGGTIAVRAADRRTGSVKTFEYRPLHNNKRLNLILTISGWMTGKVDDVRLPYSTVDPIMGDIYSLLWEPEMLQSMGDTINILATEALTQTVQQVLGSTILITLMASIQLPIVLSKLAYLIDNPWSVSLDRATAAGLILADSLIDRHLGQRPITLLGFSLGSRVIFSCLKELSNRGAYGLVQNVYIRFRKVFEWICLQRLDSRIFVSDDVRWHHASCWLAPVEGIPGVENINVSTWVKGHMAYRAAMPRLLREVGWEVESDEFTEIEDPDPENHAQRQRELILEIDEARKKAEEKPDKKRFGIFKRGKLAEKKGWERYNSNDPNHKRNASNTLEPGGNGDANVLFDVDAIRRELAGEMIEVRELDSTLPPMQIMSVKDGEKHVEYLRLPPGMKPEELARLNLPPRPDEVDVSFAPLQQPTPVRPARSSSLKPASIASPQRSPRVSPQRSPQPSPDPDRRSSYTYSEPRELASTLPVLTATPSASPRPESYKAPMEPVRPELKPHATDPSVPSWGRPSTAYDDSVAPPAPRLDLERNAWADDDDEFGHNRGEISMTFE
ncbi:hypothetical protein CLAIMM_14472 [Cladophialophora immunda]|nr:hypothetical protein CLAIMM_14472 [Cladophialophora immunda]